MSVSTHTSASVAQAPEKKVFSTLQAGRALAAVAVVTFHAHVFFIPERLYPGQSISRVFDIGYSGVEFFFVLSGFIMFLVHRRDIGGRALARRFIERRILRIIPFYWVVTLLMLALLLVQLPETAYEISMQRVLHSALLIPLPDGSPLLVGAAWTLTHEFLFYAFFAVLIFAPWIGVAAFLLWIGATVSAALGQTPVYSANVLLSPYNLLFPMGILAAFVFPYLPVRAGWALALAGATAFVTVGLLDAYRITAIDHSARTLAFGLAAGCVVAGLAALERSGLLKAPNWMSFLGDASYAIYLVHVVALPVIARLMVAGGINTMLSPVAGFAVLVGAAVVVGAAAHVALEKPLSRTIRARLSRRLPS